jgi:DNA polymerase-3 subunit alpha
MKELKNWIEQKSIKCNIEGNIVEIEGLGKLVFVEEKEGKVISNDFSFILTEEEFYRIYEEDITHILFKWGDKFYYSSKKTKKDEYNEDIFIPEFKEFINVGSYDSDLEIDFIHLGVHTGYELLNGSAEPEQWVAKTVFLGQKILGLSDKNTLAATLPFQLACKKKGVKSILGETISVAYEYNQDDEHHSLFDIKLFVKNEIGWKNLLRIGKFINVDNDKFVSEEDFLNHSEGLICVIPTDSYFNSNIKNDIGRKMIKKYKKIFKGDLYYQIDSVEFDDDSVDIQNLRNIRYYMDNYSDVLKPVLINDSYYIEKSDYKIKSVLNKVDKKTQLSSSDQYYKTIDETLDKLMPHFSKNPDKFDLILESVSNTVEIAEKCDYMIDTGNHKLPKFEHPDSESLYHELLEKGFQRKVIDKFPDDEDKIIQYYERLEEENSVIVGAGFVDYFLILWDIVEWCKTKDILVGPGRGSAGGSLVAYLLGIIEIDPIQYNLLFERFLNKTRVSGERAKSADALPDIDIDFEGLRRGDVKRYIEEKYTYNNVCSIGTYARMKVKSALKDFSRVSGVSFQDANFATKEIPDVIGKSSWGDIFENAVEKPVLKKFVQNNAEVCDLVRISINQPKTSSIHASAVLIVPKQDKSGNPMTIYDWMPVKKIDDQLVSEWEGKFIDAAGFLKADILGIAQLDKFRNTLDLIKKNRGKKVNLNKIKIDIPSVMEFFKNGWNEDVFQFGTSGLKTYSKQVKPDGVEDLISMNALFRPGPMDSNAHKDFAEIKHGKKKPVYDPFLKEVTKNTFGLYVYQEQIMQAMVVAGGLSLAESDQVRTYMKKFDKENLNLFKSRFVEYYNNLLGGDKEEDAVKIWDKMNAFSSYGFNRSHAAAYALMGYWCQYLKVKYPLEFWTASLNFANYEEEVPNRISEIRKIGSDIQIKPPCVNKSDLFFVGFPDDNSIYWSLTKIKNVGDVAARVILNERNQNGDFSDLEDFINRVPKNKVNKRVVKALIIAGAFDNIGGQYGLKIDEEKVRKSLLEFHANLTKSEPYPEVLNENSNSNWYWVTEQKALTGFGDINFLSLLQKYEKKSKIKNLVKNYVSAEEYDKKSYKELKSPKEATIVGRIMYIKHLKYKQSKLPYARVSIESNNVVMILTVWNDCYERVLEKMEKLEAKKSLIAVNCEINYQKEYGKSLNSISERRGSTRNRTEFLVIN